jgi:hypothetical protein
MDCFDDGRPCDGDCLVKEYCSHGKEKRLSLDSVEIALREAGLLNSNESIRLMWAEPDKTIVLALKESNSWPEIPDGEGTKE